MHAQTSLITSFSHFSVTIDCCKIPYKEISALYLLYGECAAGGLMGWGPGGGDWKIKSQKASTLCNAGKTYTLYLEHLI